MVVEARQTFQAFDDAGLRAPVRLACGKIGNDESNLAQHVHALATYWKLFRAQYPDHEIFDKLTEEQLRLTALDEAMDLLADDFLDAMSQGVLLQSHAQPVVLRLAVVAVKGDWPFLIEAGHSERHFRRALEYVTCAWLEQLDAATVARHGLLALRAYKRCAVLSVEMKEPYEKEAENPEKYKKT
ncbi:unnamed protein product [Durusdinium trenchii]|uniref:Queuosine salvage protein n=1 Tax=Durusdinium trenchii TaxID=1381693 RepID=A0ABP0NKA2_9DINO